MPLQTASAMPPAESKWSLPELQRQFAYDRLLERLSETGHLWIVKGAAALLARGLAVRATVDVDLYRATTTDAAEAELRTAALMDLGDWVRFAVGAAVPITGGTEGCRLPVRTYIGQTVWADFKIDIVGPDVRMTGTPDHVPALASIGVDDVTQHGYRAYPLVDHVADKIAAMLANCGQSGAPSSRYKDLIDLFAIVRAASLPAEGQRAALVSEAERRGIVLPPRFTIRDPTRWERGYAAEAKRSILATTHMLDDALAVVTPFVDPLLAGIAVGKWNPDSGRWEL